MNTFSSDAFNVTPVGINSKVVQGVPRLPVAKVPIPILTKKQKKIKEIVDSLFRILDKINR
jgi:hypothetical protein